MKGGWKQKTRFSGESCAFSWNRLKIKAKFWTELGVVIWTQYSFAHIIRTCYFNRLQFTHIIESCQNMSLPKNT